jgi:hypothetical protein
MIRGQRETANIFTSREVCVQWDEKVCYLRPRKCCHRPTAEPETHVLVLAAYSGSPNRKFDAFEDIQYKFSYSVTHSGL